MKKKRRLMISAIVVIILLISGWSAMRFGINFIFDKYVLGTTLSSLGENEEKTSEKQETAAPTQTQPVQGEKADESSAQDKAKQKLTNTEVINRVLKSSKLTNKMASMVSYDDKKKVISIVMSNFSAEELAEIAKNVKGGITASYKSQMVSEVYSRLTSSQWQECLEIAYKYVDLIRPYVE